VGAAFTDRALLWGPYRSFQQMLAEDPRASEANPMFRRTAHPGVGEFLTATSPLRFGGDALPPGLAPRLGEHTQAVLQQLLALDPPQLRALQDAGALESA
jgi:2-methylfumaryl-CoA isomerase